MIRHAAVAICVLLLALATAGCGMTGNNLSNNTIHVSVSQGGDITVNGKTTELSQLAGKLKSLGATADTCIKVSVPKETPTSTMSEITRNLASAGFRKIIFTRPKQVDSFLKTEKDYSQHPYGKK